MMGRLALAATLGVGALLAGPALAEDMPIDIVRALYDDHPHESDPPGGLELWAPHMQVLWMQLNEDTQKRMSGELDFQGEGLTFDFMTGTQEFWFDDLKLKTVIEMEEEAQVLAVMNNGADAPFALRYGFIRHDVEGWQIAEVWRDEGWRLSELIQETR